MKSWKRKIVCLSDIDVDDDDDDEEEEDEEEEDEEEDEEEGGLRSGRKSENWRRMEGARS